MLLWRRWNNVVWFGIAGRVNILGFSINEHEMNNEAGLVEHYFRFL
jgi:hypothetical protein